MLVNLKTQHRKDDQYVHLLTKVHVDLMRRPLLSFHYLFWIKAQNDINPIRDAYIVTGFSIFYRIVTFSIGRKVHSTLNCEFLKSVAEEIKLRI